MVFVSPAPAIIAAARRRLIRRFRQAGGTSEASAIANPARHLTERRMFDRLLRAGVILPAAGGRYWLNEERQAEWTASRRKRGLIAAGAALAAAAIAFALGSN